MFYGEATVVKKALFWFHSFLLNTLLFHFGGGFINKIARMKSLRKDYDLNEEYEESYTENNYEEEENEEYISRDTKEGDSFTRVSSEVSIIVKKKKKKVAKNNADTEPSKKVLSKEKTSFVNLEQSTENLVVRETLEEELKESVEFIPVYSSNVIRWTQVKEKAKAQKNSFPRSWHSATLIKDAQKNQKIVLWGGSAGENIQTQLQAYDCTEHTKRNLSVTGNEPLPRYGKTFPKCIFTHPYLFLRSKLSTRT